MERQASKLKLEANVHHLEECPRAIPYTHFTGTQLPLGRYPQEEHIFALITLSHTSKASHRTRLHLLNV